MKVTNSYLHCECGKIRVNSFYSESKGQNDLLNLGGQYFTVDPWDGGSSWGTDAYL